MTRLNEQALEAARQAHMDEFGTLDDAITAYLNALPSVDVDGLVERLGGRAKRRMGHIVLDNVAYYEEADAKLDREAASLIESQAARIAELEALVDQAEGIFVNCSVTDGVCCCGDDMEKHPEPMSCGHSPVDHGSYAVHCWMESKALLNRRAEG